MKLSLLAKYISLATLLLVVIFATIYLSDVRQPTDVAVDALQSDDDVIVTNGEWIEMVPNGQNYTNGIIFLQGGKVKAEAYVPMFKPLAAQGYLVVMPKTIFSLSIAMPNEPTRIINHYNVTSWTIAGHSLGGVVAAQYTYNNPEAIDNLILMASVANNNLSDADVNVLSIYGENDGLSTPEESLDSAAFLPADTVFEEIEGGNHAQFGYYGEQSGDGEATISTAEQHNITQTLILNFLGSNPGSSSDIIKVETLTDANAISRILYPVRQIPSPLSARQFIVLFWYNIIFTAIPLVATYRATRMFIVTKQFRNEVRPIMIIAWSMVFARLLPALNRFAGIYSGGEREFILTEVTSNIIPFVFIFSSLAVLLRVYIRVPENRRRRFNLVIQFSRLSAAVTVVGLIGLFIVEIFATQGLGQTIFTFFAYLLFLVIVILLVVIYRFLQREEAERAAKLIKLKVTIFKYLTLITFVYLITAVLITFLVIFNPDLIDRYASSVFITLYSCAYTGIGSFLTLWILDAPNWIKKRYGLVIPKKFT